MDNNMENKEMELYISQRGKEIPARLNLHATDDNTTDNYILSRKQIRERLDNKNKAKWDKQEKENFINECSNEIIKRVEEHIIKLIDDILRS